ncbi:MAG: hypothetical protein QXX95_02925 [Nitrososphaerales archaeon]
MNTCLVGLTSGGCRVLKDLSRVCGKNSKCIYISFDEEDLPTKEGSLLLKANLKDFNSIYKLRGKAKHQLSKLDDLIEGSSFVIVINGLGCKTGSALAPLICERIKAKGIMSLFIGLMPFKFEKNKHFLAGRTLEYIRKLCDGVILIDNDELLDLYPNHTLEEAYSLANKTVTSLLSMLLHANEYGFTLRKLFTQVSQGYTILSLADSKERVEDAIEEVLSRAWSQVNLSKANGLTALLKGKVTLKQLEEIVNILRVQGDDFELNTFVSSDNSAGIRAALVVSGLSYTKFNNYDPLLTLNQLDAEFEYNMNNSAEGISNLTNIEV